MEKWKEYKLGDISTMKYGKLPPSPSEEGKYPIWSGYRYVGMADSFNCSKGTMVVVARGVGGTGDVKIAKEDCYLTNLSISVDVNTKVCNPYYLHYKYSIKNLRYLDSGSAQSQITIDALKNLVIEIPPLAYQNKVVDVLKSLDAKIEVNKRINDNLEQQAQALFKSWFVDFEPFKDGEFVESELGMIPKGWKVGTLNEIADITMGASPSGTSYNVTGEGDVFYQGRAEFGFRFPNRNMYTTAPKRFAEIDSVLLSVRAPVGDINVAEEKCCIGRGLASVKSNKGNNSYILYLMKSLNSVFDQFNGEGTVFGSINKKGLEQLSIIIPREEDINKFDKICNPFDMHIKKCETESRRLAQLRDTLLPRLMSGELDVNNVAL